MNKGENKKHPSEDAFLTTPLASANDWTGYGIKIPLSDAEANSLSDMMRDVPTAASKYGKAAKDKRKTRNTMP